MRELTSLVQDEYLYPGRAGRPNEAGLATIERFGGRIGYYTSHSIGCLLPRAAAYLVSGAQPRGRHFRTLTARSAAALTCAPTARLGPSRAQWIVWAVRVARNRTDPVSVATLQCSKTQRRNDNNYRKY